MCTVSFKVQPIINNFNPKKMKKTILAICLVAFSLTSNAHVIWGKYKGFRKVKGTIVVKCSNNPNKICAFIESVEDSDERILTVKDEDGTTVLEAHCDANYTSEPSDEDSIEYTFVELP